MIQYGRKHLVNIGETVGERIRRQKLCFYLYPSDSVTCIYSTSIVKRCLCDRNSMIQYDCELQVNIGQSVTWGVGGWGWRVKTNLKAIIQFHSLN